MNTYNMHMWGGNMPWFSGLGFLGFGILGLFGIVIALALLALKGYALWNAAKRNEKGWFIALLILNTFGILELIYLYIIGKLVKKHHEHHDHNHEHHNHS